MIRFGVIMAGGGGTRFWPMSRIYMPKQLLNLSGKNAMINETVARLKKVVDEAGIFIVTNVGQAENLKKVTDKFYPSLNIIKEPCSRNTAACIGYAAVKILTLHGDGVLIVTPSDAYIKDEEEYADVLKKAADAAERTEGIVTLGITPSFPATGYGYIKVGEETCGVRKAACFVEKPDKDTAEKYLASGDYVWNSGVFVFKASVILEKIRQLMPSLYEGLAQIRKAFGTADEENAIKNIYGNLPSVSVDYGVMEKADNIYVLPCNPGWNDVGSWDMLGALHEKDEKGNISLGDNVLVDTEDSFVVSGGRTVALLGVKGLVVVETPDAVLVCPKDRAQDVRKITDILKANGKTELL